MRAQLKGTSAVILLLLCIGQAIAESTQSKSSDTTETNAATEETNPPKETNPIYTIEPCYVGPVEPNSGGGTATAEAGTAVAVAGYSGNPDQSVSSSEDGVVTIQPYPLPGATKPGAATGEKGQTSPGYAGSSVIEGGGSDPVEPINIEAPYPGNPCLPLPLGRPDQTDPSINIGDAPPGGTVSITDTDGDGIGDKVEYSDGSTSSSGGTAEPGSMPGSSGDGNSTGAEPVDFDGESAMPLINDNGDGTATKVSTAEMAAAAADAPSSDSSRVVLAVNAAAVFAVAVMMM